jgi:hypothetical protein
VHFSCRHCDCILHHSVLKPYAGGSWDVCNFVYVDLSPTDQNLLLYSHRCSSCKSIEKYIEFDMRIDSANFSVLIISENCNLKCISTSSSAILCKFQFNLHAHYNLWINIWMKFFYIINVWHAGKVEGGRMRIINAKEIQLTPSWCWLKCIAKFYIYKTSDYAAFQLIFQLFLRCFTVILF